MKYYGLVVVELNYFVFKKKRGAGNGSNIIGSSSGKWTRERGARQQESVSLQMRVMSALLVKRSLTLRPTWGWEPEWECCCDDAEATCRWERPTFGRVDLGCLQDLSFASFLDCYGCCLWSSNTTNVNSDGKKKKAWESFQQIPFETHKSWHVTSTAI